MSVSLTFVQLKFQEKTERLERRNIWKNRGRRFLKLGKNSRPTEKKAQKTQAEKAENKAKLTLGLIIFKSWKNEVKEKSLKHSQTKRHNYI